MLRRSPSKLAAVAILLGTAALSASGAAAATPRGGGAGQRLKAALAQLDLSAAQKQQIKQIFASAAEPKSIAGAAATEPAAKSHAAGRALMNKVMAVLTPPQRAKLKQLMQASKPTHAATP